MTYRERERERGIKNEVEGGNFAEGERERERLINQPERERERRKRRLATCAGGVLLLRVGVLWDFAAWVHGTVCSSRRPTIICLQGFNSTNTP